MVIRLKTTQSLLLNEDDMELAIIQQNCPKSFQEEIPFSFLQRMNDSLAVHSTICIPTIILLKSFKELLS